MIACGEELCANLEEAAAREWLEANGIGGFASSTIAGLNTRRYHGLLTAALKPPASRMVLLSKLEETLVVNGARYELSVNRYPDVVHPEGYRYLKGFRLDPFPVFKYAGGGAVLEKSVFLVHGENTVVVQYELLADGGCEECMLEVQPLIAFRDYHSTTHCNPQLNGQMQVAQGMATVSPYLGLPELHFGHNADTLEASSSWYYNFEYDRERERGLDYREDLFNPCLLRFAMRSGSVATVIASTVPRQASESSELRRAEIERRRRVATAALEGDDFAGHLVDAADQFLVARQGGQSVVAGYPWFGDWGRDAMIALPGLTLVTGRHDDARSILAAFLSYADQGMLPNRFPEAGEQPEYNTVDATLWMFQAVHELLRHSDDFDFVRKHLYEGMVDIIAWHERGTRYGIALDADGLVRAGEQGVQLTWMDAKVGDWVVTPRYGKPVEVEALWYNALCVMDKLARRFGDSRNAQRYYEIAAQARENFPALFWNPATGCLFDVVDGWKRDGSIRPNQILAVSLPHTMLSPSQSEGVVDVVERELLTPYGLRTLSPSDPKYRGRYEGDVASRDGAYHQGTVWPWLMGPFLTAYVRVHGGTPAAREQAAAWLDGLRRHLLHEAGLGQISEIFDGDAPHLPRGCIAQAWSVGELLRALVEEAS